MDAIETIREGGLIATLHYDEDCENPRSWDGHFLWIGFPHRRYEFGDEQVDPGDITRPCPTCEGQGYLQDGADCTECEDGQVPCTSLDEVIEELRRQHEALQAEPVSMTDHSGTSYYLGRPRDPWDSGVCGVMMFTVKQLEEWGCSSDPDEADRATWLAACQSGEYEGSLAEWCHAKHDPDDSCWGFVGYEYAMSEMRSALDRALGKEPTCPDITTST